MFTLILCMFYSVSSDGFAIGIRFNYWKDKNKNFVAPKYSNFKEEIFCYGLLDPNLFEKEIVPKVKQYLNTNIVKAMKKAIIDEYSIKEGTPIGFDNLLSVVLYTDYDALSGGFSSTFRKKWIFEPIQQTKRRNQKYYWFSKILTETVRIYGENYMVDDLEGPFYCGMSCVMNMPQFSIELISPTSTSIHIEVAMKFSGEEGMIIQFDNEEGRAISQRAFDCSWLSRYPEEDERYIQYVFIYIHTLSNINYIYYLLYYIDYGINQIYPSTFPQSEL